MMLRHYARTLKQRIRLKHGIHLLIFRFRQFQKQQFECPICGWIGPFMDINRNGFRKHAQCPNCNALERHRLQFLIVNDVLKDRNTATLKMLHFAPEGFFCEIFAKRFGQYETADLKMDGVDHKVDLQQLPFADATYDFVFASHVLEHISNDGKALSEIRRILKPNGIAILPVPIYGVQTIEFPEPNPMEFYHVRAPGIDYFDRYERHFAKVEKFSC